MYLVIDKYNALMLSKATVILLVCLIVLSVFALYLLRSLGVYKLAKNKNVSCCKLAFIPFVWVFPLCKVVEDTRFFNTKLSKIALLFTIAFTVSGVLSLLNDVLSYFPLVGYYLQNGEVYFSSVETSLTGYSLYPLSSSYIYVKNINIPYDVNAMIITHNVFASVIGILNLFSILCSVFMYVGLFKRYTPSCYMIFALLSIFGLEPIFLFIIRNKKQVNFSDYVRSRYYGSVNNTNNSETPSENPFSEFSKKGENDPGNPFSEFDNKDHKDDN